MKKKIKEEKEVTLKSLLTILIIVSSIVGLAYTFTVAFVVQNKLEYTNTNDDKEIYASETFLKTGSLYYVLYLDMSNFTNKKVYQDIFKKSTKTLYLVDISKPVNDDIVSSTLNIKNNYEELRIKDRTLVKVVNKKIDSYKEGLTDITNELK